MRRAVLLLLAGWLLGVVTAFAVGNAAPSLLYQQRVLYGFHTTDTRLRELLSDGWVVVRSDAGILTVQRPRLRLP
jgi:hypothetical protein